MKTNLTRRGLVKSGTASGALTGSALLEWTKAWALVPERCSRVRVRERKAGV